MTDQHPITPSPELVDRWLTEWASNDDVTGPQVEYVATQAARWGADQELELCKQVILKQQWFAAPGFRLDQLHNARRPKPPSLKEQALQGLDYSLDGGYITPEAAAAIRRALESLPD